jgi:hypothetical protein
LRIRRECPPELRLLRSVDLLVCCHYPERALYGVEGAGGGVINATTRQMVLAGLTQPHSLEPDGPAFLVLDSDGRRLIRFDHTGILQQQALTGFLRGMATARGSLFVASSAGRVISRKNPTVRFRRVSSSGRTSQNPW